MILKFLSASVKDALKGIMDNEFSLENFYFYVPDIGYLQIEEINFSSDGIKVYNCTMNIDEYYNFDDELFIKI